MEIDFKTYGHVNGEGALSLYHQKDFVARLKNDYKNTSVELYLRPRFYEFSDDHRAYYFGVIVRELQKAHRRSGVIKSLGDIDLEMRDMFLYYEEFDNDAGEFVKHIHTLRKGQTKVSKQMMSDFCNICIYWAIVNLDWAIPFPNEVLQVKDKTQKQLRIKDVRDILKSSFE